MTLGTMIDIAPSADIAPLVDRAAHCTKFPGKYNCWFFTNQFLPSATMNHESINRVKVWKNGDGLKVWGGMVGRGERVRVMEVAEQIQT